MLKKYNEIVRKKMFFVYGDRAEKKMRERKNSFIAIPALAALAGTAFAICGFDAKKCIPAALAAGAAVLVLQERNIFTKSRNKCNRMRMELSEVLDRTALLLEAGTSLWNAIITVSSVSDLRHGTLVEELKKTVACFYDGNGYIYDPEDAFEDLADRCDDPYISTFVSLVVQNSRKGTSELADMMRMQAVNARNERRLLAKQLSDEAASLMLIPSGMILVAILVITAAPAVMQLLNL